MKKLLALLLAAILCVTLVSSVAFAGESGDSAAVEGQSEGGESGESAEGESEELDLATLLAGGWQNNTELPEVLLPEGSKTAFDKALEGFVGVGYTPLVLLGTQVVAGTNYAYLAVGTTVTATPVTDLYLVVVYEDLEGNAQITSSYKFSVGELLTIIEALSAASLGVEGEESEPVPAE